MAAVRTTLLKVFLLFLVMTILAVLTLRWVNPPISAFILATPGSYQQKKPVWSDWEEISPWLPMAIIASEDQKFPFHWGFDATAIQQAIMDKLDGGRMRGASTITQQLAKNLFLWSDRSWLRKGIEVYFTLLLEGFLPKRRILELYINLVEFGPQVFGASSTARRYFNKSTAKINAREACMMAAVLPSPRSNDLRKPSKRLKARAARIRKQITALGGVGYLQNL